MSHVNTAGAGPDRGVVPAQRSAVLILAAGGSERLGRPKQLIDYAGEPLLRRSARTAVDADIGPVFVVLGSQANICRTALDGLDVTVLMNSDWRYGLSRSIRVGMLHITEMPVASVVIMLCDQPEVSAEHLRNLIAALHEPMLAAGTGYSRDVGVPAAFSRAMFAQLITLMGDRGAKDLLRQWRHVCATVSLEAAALDVDTPEDVARVQGSPGTPNP